MPKFTHASLGAAFALAIFWPSVSCAQINNGLHDQGFGDLNLQTSVTFSMPLGSTDHRKLSHQPRLGLSLNLARDDFKSPIGRYGSERLKLLDVGAYGFKTPSLEFSGQEIYKPTYAILHADDNAESEADSEESKTRDNSLLLVGAGVAVVTLGSLVILNEAADDISDCFLVFTDVPDKCRD